MERIFEVKAVAQQYENPVDFVNALAGAAQEVYEEVMSNVYAYVRESWGFELDPCVQAGHGTVYVNNAAGEAIGKFDFTRETNWFLDAVNSSDSLAEIEQCMRKHYSDFLGR